MPPKTKFITQNNNRWQLDEQGVTHSQQSKSPPNANQETVINRPNPEPMQGIVKSLINFFEEG